MTKVDFKSIDLVVYIIFIRNNGSLGIYIKNIFDNIIT